MEQIKNARMSRQIREQDLASENESRTFLTDIQNRIKQEGGPGLREAVPQMLVHPNLKIRQAAGAIQEHLDRLDRLAEYKNLNPEDQPVAPTTGATVSPYIAPKLSLLETGPEGAAPRTFQNAPPGMAGVTVGTAERGGNVSPAAAASTNALIPEEFKQKIQNELARAEKFARYYELQAARDPKGFKDEAKQAREYANSLRKMQSIEPNRLLMMGDVSMLTPPAPEGMPADQRMFNAYMNMTPEQQAAFDRFQKSNKPNTSVNLSVSTEGKYGGAFAGKLAESDINLRDAAANAPDAARNANRILEVLSTGNIIAGPGAEWKLKAAKLLNASGLPGFVGKDNTELISNTEQLQMGLASQTLDAIKTSGLGTGAGFTNVDRDFLEKAKSGNIDMTPETLRRTAELARRSAEATAEKWNTRIQQIPRSAVQGTGLSVEPVVLPSKSESRKSVASDIPQAAIDFLKKGLGTREQFDAQFGAGSAKKVLGN